MPKKLRKDRWDYREHIKEMSNKRNSVLHTHPQVRRELDRLDATKKT